MIKFERTSVMNFENAIRGARNPMNSWDRMDSHTEPDGTFLLVGRLVDDVAADRTLVSVEELAALMGTITYEVTCLISPRVPRVYKG